MRVRIKQHIRHEKKYTILSIFTATVLSMSAFAGNGDYDLAKINADSPSLVPNKSIMSIQNTAASKGMTEGGFLSF